MPEYAKTPYIYSDATEKQARRARLVWRAGSGPERTMEDASYPFEFSLRLRGRTRRCASRLEAESPGRRLATPRSWS